MERKNRLKKISSLGILSAAVDEVTLEAAVVVVDVQGDFTTYKKGSLAVAGSDKAYINKVEAAVKKLKAKGLKIYATQDWHPKDHLSFCTNHPGQKPFSVIKMHGEPQVMWPPHCIQGTENAKILIDNSLFTLVAQKGTMKDWDSYSGFYMGDGKKTVLEEALKKAGIDKLIMFGIATDYCVKTTAIDGAKLGFKVTVIQDLCRSVDPKTTAEAIKDMEANGVKVVKALDLNMIK